MNNKIKLTEINDLIPLKDTLITLRHHLHQYPELSNEEITTSALIAKKLCKWGYAVTTGIGGHGVVGTLHIGTSYRTLGLRADMDALPIQEENNMLYTSQIPGKMHACGHDGHIVMLLGAACHLAKTRNFSGTLNVLFQPAEEIGLNSGAKRMIDDGLFDRFPCDAVFGMHNHPGYPSKTLMFRSGPFMAACDTVNITIYGKGGHAARPHFVIDPIVTASSLVMALQTIVSRNIDPLETAVITVSTFNAGQASNVIPNNTKLALSVRSFDASVRHKLKLQIYSLVKSHVASFGASTEINYIPGYPVLINQSEQTEFAYQVARDLLGDTHVIMPLPVITSSEDFSYFLQQRPGCFLRIGNGDSAMLHQVSYDFNDDNLIVGAAYWARLTEHYLHN